MGCNSSAPISNTDASKGEPKKAKGKTGGDDAYKPIHSACRWNTMPIEEIKKLVTSAPGAMNIVDPGNGNTPLHIAAQNGHTNIVKLLLEVKASVNLKNSAGNTPLHMSVEYDYYETSKLLVDAGADLNIENGKNVRACNGIDGAKHYRLMPILVATHPDHILKVFDGIKSLEVQLEKSSFASMGLKMKKQLGPDVWTEEVQDTFKEILSTLK
jgi:ankyrin repeat protein